MRGLDFLPRVRVMTSEYLVERKQIRFSTRKKKRVVKKMAKNPRNWATVPQQHMIFIPAEMVIICHPAMVSKVHQLLAQKVRTA